MNNYQSFFKNEVPKLLNSLSANSSALWGSMNAIQMLDHLRGHCRIMLEQIELTLEISVEKLPKYKAYLMSDKPFQEGAKKPKVYDEFEVGAEEDISALKQSFLEDLERLEKTTRVRADYKSWHPYFGELDSEATRQLLYKHIQHHFKQFGLLN